MDDKNPRKREREETKEQEREENCAGNAATSETRFAAHANAPELEQENKRARIETDEEKEIRRKESENENKTAAIPNDEGQLHLPLLSGNDTGSDDRSDAVWLEFGKQNMGETIFSMDDSELEKMAEVQNVSKSSSMEMIRGGRSVSREESRDEKNVSFELDENGPSFEVTREGLVKESANCQTPLASNSGDVKASSDANSTVTTDSVDNADDGASSNAAADDNAVGGASSNAAADDNAVDGASCSSNDDSNTDDSNTDEAVIAESYLLAIVVGANMNEVPELRRTKFTIRIPSTRTIASIRGKIL